MTSDLSIGVIGTGNIGTSHARSLAREVSGAEVTWLFDADTARASGLADELGANVAPSVEQLIASVDAVVIASPDDLHPEQALICLDAQRPTLCEKPLGPTVAGATAVVDAEVDLGRRLISLGFMRRFDPGYAALKAGIPSVGEPLLVHNVHRNAFAPYGLKSSMTLTNAAIHELDINRWLLDDEYSTVQVITGRPGPRTPAGEFDPLLVILTTERGTLVEIEAFINAAYGYEVRCEVVASDGTLDMGDGSFVTRRSARSVGHDVPELWLGRFGDAYRLQLQAWVDATHSGRTSGASAWDGLVATITANAAVAAITEGPQVIDLPPKPALYA
ncbi:MAG: Gfo/Idh/MocA family protein [Candidatus Nanopelagicales bacterium]